MVVADFHIDAHPIEQVCMNELNTRRTGVGRLRIGVGKISCLARARDVFAL
jgi:hypothetical protein